jgi:gamma-glutamylcyclotransferase (GGCT)/AIG2-like uncharacterized protein YtfP
VDTYLFVYGTLLTGTGQPHLDRLLREHADNLGPATLRARLYDLGPFPGAVPSSRPRDRVVGQLFRLHRPALLAPLDRYEGYRADAEAASGFVRRSARVTLGEAHGTVVAWV